MLRWGIIATLILAVTGSGAMASRILPEGGTDYGGDAPTSYYVGGDYKNESATSQFYEILGGGYGPDGAAPSDNHDGVSFSQWTIGGTVWVEWKLNQLQSDIRLYGAGEYFNLWKDLDRNGKWEDKELIYSDYRKPGDTGWTDYSPGIKTFTGSFVDPIGAEVGWTWVHARLSGSSNVTASPSYSAVAWDYGESEDYYILQTPEPCLGLLLLLGLVPVGLGLRRRRQTDAAR